MFGVSIGGIFNKMGVPATEAKGLWRASLLKAVAARELALKTDPAIAEEAYVCGLLQDISLPVIHATDASAWPETSAILDLENKARRQREEAMYSSDHGAIGKEIAARMGLPELFQNATAHHHGDAAALAVLGSPALAGAVEFAAVLPHRLAAFNASVSQKLATKLAALDPNHTIDHGGLLKAVANGYAGTLALLGESDESSAAVKEFLQSVGAEVAGILEAAISESLSQISQLKHRSAELEGRIVDLKRKRFRRTTTCSPRRSPAEGSSPGPSGSWRWRESTTPCEVGFVDVDNFKALNDKLGLAGGDGALAAVAEKLCEHYRGRGIVGRVGGDEFAFLMIARTRDDVTTESDRLTTALAGMSVTSPADPAATVPLTTSIGMLWLGVPTAGQTADVTLTSADGVMRDARRKRAELAAFVQAG